MCLGVLRVLRICLSVAAFASLLMSEFLVRIALLEKHEVRTMLSPTV